ncbi:MAG TPA: NADH-quinone oxidoreductase subunit NuoG [Candidatus Saccharimonadales bacterium]|nr:NADH-quinone oxidoreductase subunit NuoG [Candidatus Saccharimonadales bacterium]
MADATQNTTQNVTLTVNGQTITAPKGTLLIEACKPYGIEIPAFCYYPGLSLQGACRMCLVEIEKMPKMQTACTTPVAEGMVVQTESEKVVQARKSTLELLLANHPLDCPVCDAGGECELQDMTFKYGAGESKFVDIKSHRDEQQWSPIVFYDRPRCILCYRCVRVCGEGMDVWALGIQNRGQGSVIAPNQGDSLDCEECGMCIDICPVGALTSGSYRYKTRPWEMTHVGTVCNHCGDGCLTTVGVRRSETGSEIVRCDNRDRSGMNDDFLCVKGRYAYDFAANPERVTTPLIKRDGKFVAATWTEAVEQIAAKFQEILLATGPQSIGVIGSNRTTNEENYLLQKFARTVLGTNNIDHHRTADFPSFARAIAANNAQTASMAEVSKASAILLIGSDPTEQHPLLAWQIRNAVRLRNSRLYVVNSKKIKLTHQAALTATIAPASEDYFVSFLTGNDAAASKLGVATDDLSKLRDTLNATSGLVIAFGSELRGEAVDALVAYGSSKGAKFICLADYANSRGAADMGLYPDLLPGYHSVGGSSRDKISWAADVPTTPGLSLPQMLDAAAAGDLRALWVVGSNPAARYPDTEAFSRSFLVVQDMFLTETAQDADVFLPAAFAYEKAGTVTNTCGDLQRLKKASDVHGVKPDFEIIIRLAEKMGADIDKLVPFRGYTFADAGQSRGAQSGEADRNAVYTEARGLASRTSPLDPTIVLDEISQLLPGYAISRLDLAAGNPQRTELIQIEPAGIPSHPELIAPAGNSLFTSGTLGRYSETLNSVVENRRNTTEPIGAD